MFVTRRSGGFLLQLERRLVLQESIGCSYISNRSFSKKKKKNEDSDSDSAQSSGAAAQLDMKECEKKMLSFIDIFKTELGRIRTGRPDPAMLDHVKIEAYGDRVDLSAVAQISVKSPKLLTVNPFDPKMVSDIVKAIQVADLNLNPSVANDSIQVPIPKVTKEVRDAGVKRARELKEKTKNSVKSVRTKYSQQLSAMKKEKTASEDVIFQYSKSLDDVTQKMNKLIDEATETREKEIASS